MKKIIITGIIIVAACVAGWFGYNYYTNGGMTDYTAQQNLNAPIEIPDVGIVTIQELKDIEKPTVVLFYADWCTFCRRFMPDYGKIAKKFKEKFNFVVINCDYQENEEYVKNFHIVGFPSLFIIDNQIGYHFPLNQSVVADNDIFKDELNDYLTFRTSILEKLSKQ